MPAAADFMVVVLIVAMILHEILVIGTIVIIVETQLTIMIVRGPTIVIQI